MRTPSGGPGLGDGNSGRGFRIEGLEMDTANLTGTQSGCTMSTLSGRGPFSVQLFDSCSSFKIREPLLVLFSILLLPPTVVCSFLPWFVRNSARSISKFSSSSRERRRRKPARGRRLCLLSLAPCAPGRRLAVSARRNLQRSSPAGRAAT